MQDILVQISNYGFPMVVAVYLLVRVEKKLDALTAAIGRLEQVLGGFLRSPLPGEAVVQAADLPAGRQPLEQLSGR